MEGDRILVVELIDGRKEVPILMNLKYTRNHKNLNSHWFKLL